MTGRFYIQHSYTKYPSWMKQSLEKHRVTVTVLNTQRWSVACVARLDPLDWFHYVHVLYLTRLFRTLTLQPSLSPVKPKQNKPDEIAFAHAIQ